MDSAESAGGRLGAVLVGPRTGVVALGRHGPWLTTTPDQARQVLSGVPDFDFPGDVTRSGDLSASRGDTRSGHVVFAPAAARARSRAAWPSSPPSGTRQSRRMVGRPQGEPYDAVLSAASSCGAIHDIRGAGLARPRPTRPRRRPGARLDRRSRSCDRCSTPSPPVEPGTSQGARRALGARTTPWPPSPTSTAHQMTATMLAAGIQVPIAAGAWLLALARQPPDDRGVDPVHVVWETLRLTPPTWITARITTREVDLGGQRVPSGRRRLVSPILLGRLHELVPGRSRRPASFDPRRWQSGTQRPGAWLPFGAGPHACPGRHLGMALLTHLAGWGLSRTLTLSERVTIDQSRGIAPLPCRFTISDGREPVR